MPSIKVKEEVARIKALDEPEKKMSKSASSPYNYLALADDPEEAAKKVKKAVTDTGKEIKYDEENKPGLSNLLQIYSFLSEKPVEKLEQEYQGKGYGEFKKDLGEVVRQFLADFQTEYNRIDNERVEEVLKEGKEQVEPVAKETLERVKEKIGII